MHPAPLSPAGGADDALAWLGAGEAIAGPSDGDAAAVAGDAGDTSHAFAAEAAEAADDVWEVSGAESADEAHPGDGPGDAADGVLALVAMEARPSPYGKPGERSLSQKALAGARMREGKVRKHLVRVSQQQAEKVSAFTESLNACNSLLNAALRAHKQRGTHFGLTLITRGVRSGRKGRQFVLAWGSMIKIAFMKSFSRACLAESLSCSSLTVRRVLELVAYIYMRWQDAQIKTLLALVSAGNVSLDFAIVSLMWDETGQVVSLAASPGTSAGHQSSTWSTCIAKFSICYGWSGKIMMYSLVCPPIPLLSTGAKHMYNALTQHPVTKPIWDLARALWRRARYSLLVHQGDGHLANEKLHFHRLQMEAQLAADSDRDHVLSVFVRCCNHTTNLTLIATLQATGLEVFTDMYATVMYLRMGGHFLRLAASVQSLVDDTLDWERDPSDLALSLSRQFWSEMVDYLTVNRECDRSAAPNQQRRAPRARFQETVRATLGVTYNGVPSSPRLQHLCRGCCSSRSEAVDKVSRAILSTLIARLPPTITTPFEQYR